MTQPQVEVTSPQESTRLVTLNNPKRLNAFSRSMLRELHDQLDLVASDPTCRCVVLTGAGRAFCAGVDLVEHEGEIPTAGVRSAMELQQEIAALVPKLRNLPMPVIAAVNGPAVGGGLALALASDIRLASPTASFSSAFVRIGLSGCDIGVSWLLPRLIGAGRAFELMLSGRPVDAVEADRIGLVNRIGDDPVALALEVADSIVRNSPYGVQMTKEVMWSQLEVASLQAGIDLENRTQVMLSLTRDHQEAVLAFTERRPAVFRNE